MVEELLKTTFLGIALKNPLVVASGVLGTSASLMERAAIEGAGAVTSKSAGPTARSGHANPVTLAWGNSVINAIGLTNPGCQDELPILVETKKRLNALGVPLFASIFAGTVEEFGEVAKVIAQAKPDLIEVNISCPNVASDFGEPFSANPASAAAVTHSVRAAVSVPISVKLAPNVPNLAQIAKAVVAEGADAITAINTVPAMLIDAYAARPVLKNKTGGLSGLAIKPIALRAIWELAQVVSVPIIGTGGVTTGLDAAEMIMAGASLVGVGSAVVNDGPAVFARIARELSEFMQLEGYQSLEEMRGKAWRAS
jgi:dihydroorotate dehydrogenase (NAD+) catalytic subunit